jgi:predicted nucleic acid-binding protein
VKLVLDASVALKWFFQDNDADADVALRILDTLSAGAVQMYEPPHFLAEMAAVLIRHKSDAAHEDLADLQALLWERVEADEVYVDAVDLANRLQHHLFDTLYHAVALNVGDAVLVTADRRYWRKAKEIGRVVVLNAVKI